MRWVRGMYVCGGREEKNKGGVHGWWGKEKEKKKWRVGFTCIVGKKKLKGKKLNWFYLYVHFVWCKV